MRSIKIYVLLSLMLLVTGQAWGATYYVKQISGTIYYKSGSVPTEADTSAGDLEVITAAVADNDTIVIVGGLGASSTYTGTQLDADNSLLISKPITLTTTGGAVIFDVNGQNAVGINIAAGAAGTVISGDIRVTNNSLAGTAFLVDVSGAATINGVYVYNGDRGFNLKAATTLNHCHVANMDYRGIYATAAGSVVNYSLVEGTTAEGVTINSAGSTLKLNNSIVVGALQYPVRAIDGSIVVSNSYIGPCVSQANNTPTFQEDGSGAITVDHSFYSASPYRWLAGVELISSGTVTITNSFRQPIRFTSGRRPAKIAFCVDDLEGLDYYTNTVAPALAVYGWKGTLALNATLSAGLNWAGVQALVAAGHEIASHGRAGDRMDTPASGGLTFTYTGACDTATATLSDSDSDGFVDQLITTIVGAGSADSIVTPVSLTAKPLLGSGTNNLAAYLEALSNYTCTVVGTTSYDEHYSTTLAAGTYNIKSGAVENIPLSAEKVYDWNLTGSKSDIEANIPGYTVTTFVPPGNYTNSDLEDALLARSFVGARGNSTSELSMSAINLFSIKTIGSATLLSSTEPDLAEARERVGSIIEWAKYLGGVFVFHTHVDQLTATGLANVMQAAYEADADVVTIGEAIAYAKTYDPSSDLATADSKTYTRTMVNAADYSLQSDSPAVGTGTRADVVGLTGVHTDYFGRTLFFAPYNVLNITGDQGGTAAAVRPSAQNIFYNGAF